MKKIALLVVITSILLLPVRELASTAIVNGFYLRYFRFLSSSSSHANQSIVGHFLSNAEPVMVADRQTLFQMDRLIRFGEEISPASERWGYFQGIRALMAGDISAAINFIDRFLGKTSSPRSLDTLLLGALYYTRGDQERAWSVWHTNSNLAHYFLLVGGDKLYRNNQVEQAIRYYKFAASSYPEACEPFYRLGMAYVLLEDENAALKAFQVANQNHCSPEFSGEVLFQLGRIHSQRGEREAAIAYLRASLNTPAGEADTKKMVLLAEQLIYDSQDNWEEAYQLLVRVTEIYPGNFFGPFKLCDLENRRGNYQVAIGWCEKAIATNPDDYAGYFRLGSVHLENGAYENALRYFKLALDRDAGQVGVWNRLGDTYLLLEEYDLAADAYNHALLVDENNAYAQRKLQEALSR